MPGAQLQEVAGDEFRGVVKVKVGPITAQYKGSAKLESVDDATHTAVISAAGRDTRGQGNASATIKLGLVPDGNGTRVEVDTDLSITGKVAQFGRGVIGDVSAKLLAQFVENLERDVLAGDLVDLTEGDDDEDDGGELMAEAVAHGAEPAASPSGNGAAVRRVDHPEAAPVDLLEVGGSPLAKRLAPLAGAVLIVLVLRWMVRRRSARRR
jgi:carbon monoxide dehydrogenase subunit G